MRAKQKSAESTELGEIIRSLVDQQGGGHNEAIVADIVENALKLLKDVKHTGDAKVIQTALRELRYAFRLFAPYAETRTYVKGDSYHVPEGVVHSAVIPKGCIAMDYFADPTRY